MKNIEWDEELLTLFEKGEFYVVNNSEYLSNLFIGRYYTPLNTCKFWWYENSLITGSNKTPIAFSQSVSLSNMRKEFKVYIQENCDIPYDYIHKLLETKLKTNQVILTGSTGEAVTVLSNTYGVLYDNLDYLKCDAWIVKSESLVNLAKQYNIKVRLYGG